MTWPVGGCFLVCVCGGGEGGGGWGCMYKQLLFAKWLRLRGQNAYLMTMALQVKRIIINYNDRHFYSAICDRQG